MKKKSPRASKGSHHQPSCPTLTSASDRSYPQNFGRYFASMSPAAGWRSILRGKKRARAHLCASAIVALGNPVNERINTRICILLVLGISRGQAELLKDGFAPRLTFAVLASIVRVQRRPLCR